MISSERASQEEQNNANFNFIAPSSECRREVTVDYNIMLSRSVCISCSGELPSMQALAENHPSEVKKTVDALSSSLNSVYDQHRMTVVAFYSEVGN